MSTDPIAPFLTWTLTFVVTVAMEKTMVSLFAFLGVIVIGHVLHNPSLLHAPSSYLFYVCKCNVLYTVSSILKWFLSIRASREKENQEKFECARSFALPFLWSLRTLGEEKDDDCREFDGSDFILLPLLHLRYLVGTKWDLVRDVFSLVTLSLPSLNMSIFKEWAIQQVILVLKMIGFWCCVAPIAAVVWLILKVAHLTYQMLTGREDITFCNNWLKKNDGDKYYYYYCNNDKQRSNTMKPLDHRMPSSPPSPSSQQQCIGDRNEMTKPQRDQIKIHVKCRQNDGEDSLLQENNHRVGDALSGSGQIMHRTISSPTGVTNCESWISQEERYDSDWLDSHWMCRESMEVYRPYEHYQPYQQEKHRNQHLY